MKYIINTVKSLEESGILVKGETIENKAEVQTGEFLVILSSNLGGVYSKTYFERKLLFALENTLDSSSSLN